MWSLFSETKWTRNAPPIFTSAVKLRSSTSAGPNHCANCSGSVHARKTIAHGALMTRLTVNLNPAAIESFFVFIFFLLGLQFFQIFIQTIKAHFPETAILLDPCLRLPHRRGLQFQRMHATAATAADQPGVFQHA